MDIGMVKLAVLLYGIVLCIFAGIFWYLYHRKIYGLPLIPVTSITVFAGFFAMIFLMTQNDIVKVIFGDENQIIRTNILNVLGNVFMGFILIITITWGLVGAGHLKNIQKRVYFHSYLMVGLLFYIVSGFFCILASLQ
jgi:hypothetical protein